MVSSMKKIKITDLYHRIYHDERWWTIPNILTLIRIGLTPVLVISMVTGKLEQAFIIVLFASLTDMLDGCIARFTHSTTHLGAFLDPIADKLFLLTTFCSLVFVDTPLLHMPLWFLLLAIAREATIMFGTLIVMIRNTSFTVAPSIWGKFTTFFQLLFIIWLFICHFTGFQPGVLNDTLLYALALFSLFSLGTYIKRGITYVFG